MGVWLRAQGLPEGRVSLSMGLDVGIPSQCGRHGPLDGILSYRNRRKGAVTDVFFLIVDAV